ncbi:siderophore ABC transporter substrate-binding protein [Entomomonas asaccharolytica]|uniref:ABC transporter substrate-binding protein n=1 Tax=Entomomonas asaccharolytica TaxID=2785331 RepID=A0A974NCT2_9GAMM|nr:ABC transporter substrate-binding protein [Entomomonas asaccharolytica]QQP84345.1 ABC transporter substrate-binding protein [Entomomonas asaccharolytica]
MRRIIKIGLIISLLMSGLASANEIDKTKMPINPKNVVSFDLGIVDSLDKLDVAVKALPKQSLPSYLDHYKADQYIDVGGLKTPNIEKIKEVKPELIIISGRQQAQSKELAAIAPTVNLTINPKDYENSFKNNMLFLAKTFDKQHQVNAALQALDKQAATIQQQAKQSNNKALIVVHYKDKLVASEQSNYAGLIHGWLGIKPVSLESVRKGNSADKLMLTNKDVAYLNPDILFVIDRNEAIGEGKLDKNAVEDSTMQAANAYKNKHIIYLTPDLWYLSGGGLESLKLQMEEVAKAFQ